MENPFDVMGRQFTTVGFSDGIGIVPVDELRDDGDYASHIEQFMVANSLFSGRYDRLWARLEAHRIDERDPGNGTRITKADLSAIWAWFLRQTPDSLRRWE